MVGSRIGSKVGSTIEGKNGTYLVKEIIGRGGNGAVYAAELIEGGEALPHKNGYAIKFLEVLSKDERERDKRSKRFIKEIEKVLYFQDNISGIIPIYDTSIFLDDNQGELWYLMPRAEKYKLENFNAQEKMKQMIQIGNCISQLHECGFAHRDIKPKNLLVFEKRLCLSDFGLIWSIEDTEGQISDYRSE